MQLGFYFDQQRCTGCKTCAMACKQWHGIPAGPAAWRRVETLEKGKFPEVWVGHLSLSCLHCATPVCVSACPTGAIAKRVEDGIVVVDQDLCIAGCFACLHVCPYQAPQFRSGDAKMEMCDLCLDRLEEGKQPLCVASCPLRALEVGPLEELERRPGAQGTAAGFPDPGQTGPSIRFRPRPLFP